MSLSISIFLRMSLLLSISIFSKMNLLLIFPKSVDILPIDISYRYCLLLNTPIPATSFLAIYGNHIREFDAANEGPTSINGWRDAGSWPRRTRNLRAHHKQVGWQELGFRGLFHSLLQSQAYSNSFLLYIDNCYCQGALQVWS